MATINRLDYAFVTDHDTGTVRPVHVASRRRMAGELLGRVMPLLAAARPRRPATEPFGTLSHTRLPDGSVLLCNSGATLDRRGPRAAAVPHVEAVHLPGGADDLGGVRPIDTWGSPSWRFPVPGGDTFGAGAAGAGPDEAARGGTEGAGSLVPEPGGRFGEDVLVTFARERPERVGPFLADVRRLFGSPAGRQIVLAEPGPETVAAWIALACASLPAEYARALTFTTRTHAPHQAPQQILGIGPDAEFDRADRVLLAHHYRVHDGLDGPGSPPVDDAWAGLAAQLWLAGVAPQRVPSEVTGDGDGDGGRGGRGGRPGQGGFDTRPLVAYMLEHGIPVRGADLLTPSVEWAAVPGNVMSLEPARRQAFLAQLARLVEEDGPGPSSPGASRAAALERLAGVCAGFAAQVPAHDLAPLALAITGGRIGAALSGAVRVTSGMLTGLPLADGAASGLHAGYAAPVRDAAVARLGSAVTEWSGLVELWYELREARASDSGSQGRLVRDTAFERKVAARLTQALLQSAGTERADAAALLDRLPAPELTRRVLEELGALTRNRMPTDLLELASSAQGDWLSRSAAAGPAPVPVRLAEAAVRLRTESAGLPDAELYERLMSLVPDLEHDPATVKTVWWLVWRHEGPGPADACRVARITAPGALARAGLQHRLTSLLTAPGPVPDGLAELAGELLSEQGYELTDREWNVAQLLVCGHEIARPDIPAAVAAEQLEQCLHPLRPVPETLQDWSTTMLARGLARANPEDLTDFRALRRVRDGRSPELLRRYLAEQLEGSFREKRVRTLVRRPQRVADLFMAWFTEWEDASPEWEHQSRRLLDEIVGEALRRMEPDLIDEVAVLLAGIGDEWADAWHGWLRKLPAAAGAEPGPGPDTRSDADGGADGGADPGGGHRADGYSRDGYGYGGGLAGGGSAGGGPFADGAYPGGGCAEAGTGAAAGDGWFAGAGAGVPPDGRSVDGRSAEERFPEERLPDGGPGGARFTAEEYVADDRGDGRHADGGEGQGPSPGTEYREGPLPDGEDGPYGAGEYGAGGYRGVGCTDERDAREDARDGWPQGAGDDPRGGTAPGQPPQTYSRDGTGPEVSGDDGRGTPGGYGPGGPGGGRTPVQEPLRPGRSYGNPPLPGRPLRPEPQQPEPYRPERYHGQPPPGQAGSGRPSVPPGGRVPGQRYPAQPPEGLRAGADGGGRGPDAPLAGNVPPEVPGVYGPHPPAPGSAAPGPDVPGPQVPGPSVPGAPGQGSPAPGGRGPGQNPVEAATHWLSRRRAAGPGGPGRRPWQPPAEEDEPDRDQGPHEQPGTPRRQGTYQPPQGPPAPRDPRLHDPRQRDTYRQDSRQDPRGPRDPRRQGPGWPEGRETDGEPPDHRPGGGPGR